MINYSIITVCFDASETIEETILSVLNQNYDSFEYIIIDGQSSDDTVEKIQPLIDKAYPKIGKAKITFISEKDRNLWHAMNKGAQLANGKWCLYLNSGDYLSHNNVLSEVSSKICDESTFYYFSRAKSEKNGEVVLERPGENQKKHGIYRRLNFCHNATFIPVSIMKEIPYDEKHKISADIDFFIKNMFENREFVFVDYILIHASYPLFSSQDHDKLLRDRTAICLKNKWYARFIHTKIKLLLRKIIRFAEIKPLLSKVLALYRNAKSVVFKND